MIRFARGAVGLAVLVGTLLAAPAAFASPLSPSQVDRHAALSVHPGAKAMAVPEGPYDCDTSVTPWKCLQWALNDFNGKQEVFWVGTGDGTDKEPGGLWHVWENADGTFSSPVSLGGTLSSGIAAAKNADGRLEVFGRAAGQDLVHIWENNRNGSQGWSTWASLGGVLALHSGVDAWRTNDRITVEVVGSDGGLHFKTQLGPNGGWPNNWS